MGARLRPNSQSCRPTHYNFVIMSSNIEVIKQTFLAGESMNVNNFVKFFTDDCRYKFGNFPEAHGPQGIVNTSGEFLKRVKAVKHNILDYCETEETVFVEMTVDYTMMDGRIHSLPCCDSIVIENDKVKEMKIFMDASPLFADPEPSSEPSSSGDAVEIKKKNEKKKKKKKKKRGGKKKKKKKKK